ncbi:MAG: phytanoyl-CoA dioxygenase family protein, partial [Gemmatimonadetes bacterium]|nr:phytanoyl-CoA dioxygenase family protein [Gemmatimonadota bacterium]
MTSAQPIIDDGVHADYASDLYRYDTEAQQVARFADIGPEQLAFFHQQGYLVIAEAFSPAQVADAAAAVYDLIDGKQPEFRGVQLEVSAQGQKLTGAARRGAVRKLMNFVDWDERFQPLATDPDLLDVLARLMDDTSVLFQEMALLKPPRGREKPWHQDCAYFNYPLGTTIIGVWIALDHADANNGCLHILPGTHREGPVNHFKRRDWQICDTDVQTKRDVVVPLAPGG